MGLPEPLWLKEAGRHTADMYLTNRPGNYKIRRELHQPIYASRKHDAWKWAPSLLLVVTMLSCSHNSNTMILFQGDPGIHNLPTNLELQRVIGGEKRFNFSTLKYENHIREKLSGEAKHIYTSLVRLKNQNKKLAVTKTEYYFVQPNGLVTQQVTNVDVGVPGIVSLVHLTTKLQAPQPIQFRKVAKRFDNVDGELFPIKNGNQYSIDIVFSYQMSQGSVNNTAQEMSWSYKFRVVEHYEGYALSKGTIPGNIYIIEKYEIDPDGNVDNTLVHFSESLGVVIKTVHQGDNYIEETRLVTMEE